MTFRSGGLWRTAYEVDFTAQSALNIKTGGNGNKVIDGKTWLWGNDGNCTSADVVPGTGIVIVASAANTGYYEGANVRTAPNLTIPVSSLIPLYDLNQNTVRVIVRMTLTGADANAEGGKLFMEYVTTPETQNAWVVKWFVGASLVFRTAESHNPTFTVQYADNATNNTDDLLGLVFIPNKGWQGWSGAYAAGEKMRLRNQRGSFIQDIAAPSIKTGSDVRLGMCQVTNNGTASLTTTFTHLRVDFDDAHPAL